MIEDKTGAVGDSDPKGLLRGLRVVALAEDLAPRLVAMLLAEHGAEVLRVVPSSYQAVDPVLDAVLARGCLETPFDVADASARARFGAFVAAADVLITDAGFELSKTWGVDVDALRAGPNPGLIHCAIPAFPEGHPLADLPGEDALAGAASCLYERALGSPAYHDLPIPSVLAGLFGACSIMAALIARLTTGRGQAVKADLFSASLLSQVLLVLIKTGVPRSLMALKMVATPFMRAWRCKDDRWVYLHITLPAHNQEMIETLERHGHEEQAREFQGILSEATVRDPSQVGSIGEAKRIIACLERVFLLRAADDWEEVLGKHLCCIKVRTIDEWVRDSSDAGMTDTAVVDDPILGALTVPGIGVQCPEQPPRMAPRVQMQAGAPGLLNSWQAAQAQAPAPTGKTLAHPLEGVRVADLSRIIAGPVAARVLAELGAEVTSLQSPTNLQWALSFHLMFNPGKRSVTLDWSDDAGKEQLGRVIDHLEPDVVLHNYRHLNIARDIGVGPEALRERHPDIVYGHLNAYGDVGEWQRRPGFEQVVQAVSGIQMTYGRGGVPRLLPTPVLDIGSGLSGALGILLGLYHKKRTGQGVFVTTHLTYMAVLLQTLPLIAAQRAARLAHARERGHELAMDPAREPLSGLLKARGGHLVVTGPRGDLETWAASLGSTTTQDDPMAALRKVLKSKRLQACHESLQALDLADRVHVVQTQKGRRLVSDLSALDLGPIPPLRRRDFPGVTKPMAYLAFPMRLSDTPAKDLDPPPMRGADTRALLAELDIQVPEGHGVIPLPPDKPFLIWLGSLLRWGWFAWRSGSI